MNGRDITEKRQTFFTRHVSGLTTTPVKLSDAIGKITIQNTSVRELTIGSDKDTLVDGEGIVLGPANIPGDGDGDSVELNTVGPIYIVSSASTDGSCTVIRE